MVMEGVASSPRRLEVLRAWLSDKRETFGDISGWCDRPRICDIAARWLCGYTKGAMTFPQAGSLEARDRMGAAVRAQLEQDPAHFTILALEPTRRPR